MMRIAYLKYRIFSILKKCVEEKQEEKKIGKLWNLLNNYVKDDLAYKVIKNKKNI